MQSSMRESAAIDAESIFGDGLFCATTFDVGHRNTTPAPNAEMTTAPVSSLVMIRRAFDGMEKILT
jgi:hypothetical protein